jgi:hypothetical protein
MGKLLVSWIVVGVLVIIYLYHAPYQTFMRECRYDEYLGGNLSDQYCTWLYFEMIDEDSWVRQIIEALQ